MVSATSLAIPFALSLLLSAHGFRKRSLSPSGAIAAFFVGFATMSAPLRMFGVTLIAFYLVGSRATKIGKTLKANLEEGHQEAGYRTAWQVLCNSFTATVAASVWASTFSPSSIHHIVLGPGIEPYVGFSVSEARQGWCPLHSEHETRLSRALLFAYLGHFACCMGDTLASELGILSSSSPRLVTTWRKVPPGTNGGMSVLGTAASALGGAFIGLVMAVVLLIQQAICLVARSPTGSLLNEASRLVLYGALGGALGSFIDSLMGATIQRTRYSQSSRRVLQDDSIAKPGDIKVVSGINILTNNQVNFLSSLMVAVVFGVLAAKNTI